MKVARLRLSDFIASHEAGNSCSGEQDVVQRPGLPELIAELARSAADSGGNASGVDKNAMAISVESSTICAPGAGEAAMRSSSTAQGTTKQRAGAAVGEKEVSICHGRRLARNFVARYQSSYALQARHGKVTQGDIPLGLMQTSLRSRLSRKPHGRHIKEEQKYLRIGNFSLNGNSHQTGDAAFTPATPHDSQHSRANTDSHNSQTRNTRESHKMHFFYAKEHSAQPGMF